MIQARFTGRRLDSEASYVRAPSNKMAAPYSQSEAIVNFPQPILNASLLKMPFP
jgi:hypothetical protein